MRPAGALSKLALRRVGARIEPGVTTAELDRVAESIIRAHGGTPAFKGYGGFPASICSSINSEIVHGIPSTEVVMRLAIALDTTPDEFLVGTARQGGEEWKNVAELLRGMDEKQLALARSFLTWLSEQTLS